MASQNGFAQTTATSDVARQVMAAYLYKFGTYIEWPDDAFPASDSPISIGVIDAPELARDLERMVRSRTVRGRQLVVRELDPEDSTAGLNILFIGGAESGRVAAILSRTQSQPILTVTETENGLSQGSIINFVVVDGKLRFEVSSSAASRNKLNISARLLVAAYRVASEPSGNLLLY